jgi:hypothetical protein
MLKMTILPGVKITGKAALMLIFGQLLIPAVLAQDAEKLLLNDYRPQSVYNIPVTRIDKASFPVIDMHSHPYAMTIPEIDHWVKVMDSCGIQKTIVLTMATGAKFDSLVGLYSGYKERFDLWCGFDYTGYDKPGFPASAVAELERCHRAGAKGVGELSARAIRRARRSGRAGRRKARRAKARRSAGESWQD